MSGDFPRRGDVFWVDLDPSLGSETRKKRPCLILSNNVGNKYSSVVIVAPISSKASRVYVFEVSTTIANKTGKIMVNQCRAVDKMRLGKRICFLDEITMKEVDTAIRVTFGIN